MKIINQSHEIIYPRSLTLDGLIFDLKAGFEQEAKLIELAGRTAYKSEDKITDSSFDSFIRKIVKNNHGAVLEFGSMMVKFVTDRGVSHELVRHRLCSFVQESTRYCDYGNDKFGNELSFIKPDGIISPSVHYDNWEAGCMAAENRYLAMRHGGLSPQRARSILPNSLKTEIVIRANFREWRHIFQLRALSRAAHPDMRSLMIPLYSRCRELLPCVFDMGDPE
jgi:thymidylate synthase (FAD)